MIELCLHHFSQFTYSVCVKLSSTNQWYVESPTVLPTKRAFRMALWVKNRFEARGTNHIVKPCEPA